jgi:hypothetical protein
VHIHHLRLHRFAVILIIALPLGCETKEKVVDIETPGANIEVERDRATGDTNIEIDRDP